MSMQPENKFRASVHRLMVPKSPHHEKMHNDYRGGTADDWYSGKLDDVWIEYKWVAKLPKRVALKPKLEPLQEVWLRDRYVEGRNVYVIVGCPDGGVLFRSPKEWILGLTDYEIMTRGDIALWISKFTTGAYEYQAKPSGRRSRKRVATEDSSDSAVAV